MNFKTEDLVAFILIFVAVLLYYVKDILGSFYSISSSAFTALSFIFVLLGVFMIITK